MKICDSCSIDVPFLLDVKIYVSKEDGNWVYFLAQLCHKCNDKLHKLEQEHRLYAILKGHSEFFKQMKEYENFKHRLVYEVNS